MQGLKNFFKKFQSLKKLVIIVLITFLAFNIFFETASGENAKFLSVDLKKIEKYAGEISKAYKKEKIKNMTASEADFEKDNNFILANFRNLIQTRDFKNLTKNDLSRIKIREARVSDLPTIVDMHNRGLNKSIWCPSPYKISVWSMIKSYQEWSKLYGKNNIVAYVAEIDGRIASIMTAVEYQKKAINKFTFVDEEIPENLWPEILIKISHEHLLLAKKRNLDKLEIAVTKGVWMEAFIRDVFKAKSVPPDTWEIERDANLNRVWTDEDYNYSNNIVMLAEERNAKEENPISWKQRTDDFNDIGKILAQTENSNTYKRKDGMMEIMIYPTPVNVKINGKWMKIEDYLKQPEEILEDKAESGKEYQMQPFEVYAGINENGKNRLSYNKDGNYVSFSLEKISYKDKKKEIVLDDAKNGNIFHSYKTSIFKDIFKSVDLKYYSTKNGVKEELIFNNSEILKNVYDPDYFGGKVVLRTKINVSPGIAAETRDDLIYFKKDGKIVFSTSKPYMYDQEKRTSFFESKLIKEGDLYYFESELDYGWMTSDEKVYPLVLDPDINLNPSADISLCSDSTCAVNNGVGMSFIKFNITSIPKNSALQSASLILTHATNYFPATITAQRFIDQTWDESSALSVFTGGSFGSVLSTVTSSEAVAETWDVLGTSSDGLIKEYGDGNTYYSIYLLNTGYTFTPAYIQNATTLIMAYYLGGGGKQAVLGTQDLYHSREGTTPPVLKVTYSSIATIFDYTSHPSEAKSIINAPGTTRSVFRK